MTGSLTCSHSWRNAPPSPAYTQTRPAWIDEQREARGLRVVEVAEEPEPRPLDDVDDRQPPQAQPGPHGERSAGHGWPINEDVRTRRERLGRGRLVPEGGDAGRHPHGPPRRRPARPAAPVRPSRTIVSSYAAVRADMEPNGPARRAPRCGRRSPRCQARPCAVPLGTRRPTRATFMRCPRERCP